LALRVPELPARQVAVFPLKPGAASFPRRESSGDRSFSLAGALCLEHDAGSGNLFDRVLLDGPSAALRAGLPLGRFTVLVHQTNGQPLWVPPDQVERIDTYTGPVRTVLLVTAGLKAPEKSLAKTAVDPQGIYARQERRAGQYRVTFRLTHYPEEPWFGARFLRLENTDTVPWRCEAYFHYPVSFIGGQAEDDQPAGAGSAPLWHDAAAGASYGAVVDTAKMRAQFWKDTLEGAGEHPDIWRELKQELKPGQVIESTVDDPEVLIFGTHANPDRPGGDTLDRLRALARVQVRLVGGQR
jgi:hypothetical protein